MACGTFAVLAAAVAVAMAGTTTAGRTIGAAVAHFLLFYAGVFALVALTASVGVGLAAADRVFMSPGGRIVGQALHRAASFAAAGFLAIHIAMEVAAGRAQAAGAVVPFLNRGKTLYLGLGTLASDLLVLIVVTGVLRGRFASGRAAWAWRVLHVIAYVCWPMAIVHGLLAGRTAKPYVDWSYGACVAAAALGLIVRLVTASRVRETPASPVQATPPAWPGDPSTAPLSAAAMGAASLAAPGMGAFPPWMAGNPVRRALPGPPARPGPPTYPGYLADPDPTGPDPAAQHDPQGPYGSLQ